MKRLQAVAVEGFAAFEGGKVVSVVVAGVDDWDVIKAAELIEAVPKLYAAVCEVSQFLHGVPNDGTDENLTRLCAMLADAEAAARGVVIRRSK